MHRVYLFLFITGVLLLLYWQFPYAVITVDEKLRILYLVLLLMLIGGGSGMARRIQRRQVVRDMLLWLGIILLLVLGYSFRGEIQHSRIVGELMPSRIQSGANGALAVTMAQDGHFHMEAEVNGTLLNFMIDTGASDIVLSRHDATAVGFDVATLNYSRHFSTANGMVSGASVRIKTLDVGEMTFHDVPASVNNAEMDTSLLGMAFLKQFSRYNVDGNRLTLTP